MADESEGNAPSGNPADEDSLAGVFRTVLTKFLQQTDDMLPAVVIAYDRAKNRATVHPQVMMGTTDGSKVSRAQIAEVPVLNIGGGGFVLSFPIKPGDFGWIKASDRDISLFLQGLQEEWPNTKRMHSFQDGLFIPDVMKAWTLDGADQERAVLQSTDGATRIAIGADTVEITTSGAFKVTAASIDLNSGTLTHNGVNVGDDHTHDNVENGPGNTGGPQ